MKYFTFSIFLLVSNSFAGAPASFDKKIQSPLTELSAISQGDYFSPFMNLKRDEKSYRNSSMKSDFLQAIATVSSYVGQYGEAKSYFDESFSGQSDLKVPIDLSSLQALDAVSALSDLAKDNQVIMINEAHHVPETRVLTIALLKPLYEKGFRYLAAETFNDIGLAESAELGFPIRSTGFYTNEPLAADIVREALRIGYTLVAYEHMESCDYQIGPTGCQDQRERGQARNLQERIFLKDPSAKVLVHAGYGHIDEKGGSHTFPWIPMAKYFKDLSGINPLTADQTEFHSKGMRANEEASYRRLVSEFSISSPTLLKDRSNQSLWSAMRGHYDIQVILPPNSGLQERPSWIFGLLNRKEVSVSPSECSQLPCLVQAILKNESQAPYVPFDQVLFTDRNISEKLYLKQGDHVLKFISENGTTSKTLKVD